MTAMLSFRVLFFQATICITSLGVLHEAASSQSAYYVQIRLQDKNIDSVHSAALKAAGLGPGAGTYLTAEDIALISGWSDESLKPLHSHIVDLGGEVVTHSIFRDTVVVSFSKKAFQSLKLSLDLGKLPSDLLSSNEKVEQVLAEIIYGTLPSHIVSHVHFVNSLSSASPFQAELPSPNLGDQVPLFARDTTSYPPARPYVHPSSAELFATYSQQRVEKYDSGLELTSGRLSLVLPAPYPGYTLQLFSPDYLGFWFGWKSASSMRITSVGMPIFGRPLGSVSPFTFLGVSNYTYMMNNLFNSPMAIMVPCSLNLNGSDISSIHYATVHDYAACMPSITINITLNFKAFGGEVYPMDINITSVHQPGVQVMSCGRVVQNSNGSLPSDLCTNISYQMSAANNAVNDISAETAVYVLYAREAGVPIAVPYGSFELSFSLPESIPSLYRDPIFLSLTSGTSDGTFTWLPHTTPKQLRKVYNAPLQNLGTSNGTITAVAPLGTYYDMSPFDLAIANGALLGANLTNEDLNVLNLTSGPSVFVENDPRQCYKGPGTVFTGAQVEASLDIQMITQFGEGSGTAFGFAATINSSYFQYGDYSEGEGVAAQNYLNQLLLGLKPMPHVLSISYGGLPLASNSSLDRGNNTLAAYDATLAKFAAMGVTVLAASGDAGVMLNYGQNNGTCNYSISASYPQASPWVTSVGATMEVKTAPDAKAVFCASMTAAGGTITSGGGFGNISQHGSPVPSWQQAVVHKYINTHKHLPSWPLQPKLNPSAHYNVKCSKKSNGSTKGCVYGRAFPDISLIGTNVPIVLSGVPLLVSGTSVTSPAMAGLVAQLNAYIRATPGMKDKTIGFMNPFLYWAARYYPDAFTDIIHGNNFVYDSNWTKCALGYETAVGWDPVTGLGMPRMSVLQKAAVQYIQLQMKH